MPPLFVQALGDRELESFGDHTSDQTSSDFRRFPNDCKQEDAGGKTAMFELPEELIIVCCHKGRFVRVAIQATGHNGPVLWDQAYSGGQITQR